MRYIIDAAFIQTRMLDRTLILPLFVCARACKYSLDARADCASVGAPEGKAKRSLTQKTACLRDRSFHTAHSKLRRPDSSMFLPTTKMRHRAQGCRMGKLCLYSQHPPTPSRSQSLNSEGSGVASSLDDGAPVALSGRAEFGFGMNVHITRLSPQSESTICLPHSRECVCQHSL